MRKDTIGNILIGVAVLNSLFLIGRLYYFFFTGNDISPLRIDEKALVTFSMVVLSVILIGIGSIFKL